MVPIVGTLEDGTSKLPGRVGGVVSPPVGLGEFSSLPLLAELTGNEDDVLLLSLDGVSRDGGVDACGAGVMTGDGSAKLQTPTRPSSTAGQQTHFVERWRRGYGGRHVATE